MSVGKEEDKGEVFVLRFNQKGLKFFFSMESNSRSQFKRICVFCGSNPGHRKVFSDAAIDLGNELVSLDFESSG